ncbi:MAG: ferric reductase-like transmembrane domain-containing protein [Pseudomonadota bacterium]
MKHIADHRLFAWIVLALPAIAMLVSGAHPADQLHPTGETSARLLILALAISPLMILTRRARWVRWLQARRRYIGVAAFAYAALHLWFYVIDMGTLDAILGEIPILSIWTGWLGFVALFIGAATSNAVSMRRLGTAWKSVQRLAYPAALLTLVHWIAVHDGLGAALAHAAPLAALELYRLLHNANRKRTPAHA